MELKEEIAAIEGIAPELVDKIVPLVQKHKDTSFSAGVGKAYQEVGTKVKTIFGVEKEEGEKETAYLERAYKLYEQGMEMDFSKRLLEPTKKELNELKEKLKNGMTDEKFKLEFDELKGKYNSTSNEFEAFKKDSEAKHKDSELNWQIKAELKGVKFNSEDKEYLNFKQNKFIETIKKDFEITNTESGLIFKGGKENGYKDFTLPELIEKNFADLIVKEQTQQANGASAVNSGAIGARIAASATQGEALEIIRQSMIAEGMKITDTNWSEKFKENMKKYQDDLKKIK
jgi:FtsZ-binding cell division protein ZapB